MVYKHENYEDLFTKETIPVFVPDCRCPEEIGRKRKFKTEIKAKEHEEKCND